MTSAGKYATIGILYDIACQLHCSCIKWGLLDDHLLDHTQFVTSIFHAFSHQWSCQVIYHLHKCIDFGLTDGEGCERFWSSIQPLILTLRVFRIVHVGCTSKHLDEQSLMRLGHWLHHKFTQCQDKKHAMQKDLVDCPIDESVLQTEWKAQIKKEIKPAPRQTKNHANHIIEVILTLQRSVDAYKATIRDLEGKLMRPMNSINVAELTLQLEEACHGAAQTSNTIVSKKATLGISDHMKLKRLLNDEFLHIGMNAQALKQHICDRLRQ
ncbi:uncharacterized protein LAESUDRAFT_737565 [Laetiporus sulphureus 93-53]|uniref:Uncharacterized protein n=1 Tax=Laetiporus sulphureus 93-53 TaxID=1314785 RepID=A0A165DM83_9APHY|nr:uncharacterized protein LAESUDRAFT_737565 [Laetiporus sulphureus 93-53]KZT05185.1 hypothetical protein LAESUDRAFT_737565 [Laetiporus sulphureus 93-53]